MSGEEGNASHVERLEDESRHAGSPIPPENFKRENRSAQEIARDILNTTFNPEEARIEDFRFYLTNLNGIMEYDRSLSEVAEMSLESFSDPDFICKTAMLGLALSSVREGKRYDKLPIEESLIILDTLIAASERDAKEVLKANDLDVLWTEIGAAAMRKNNPETLDENLVATSEEDRRVEKVEASQAFKREAKGLKKLKDEFRALAKKLNIDLIEPEGRGGSRSL